MLHIMLPDFTAHDVSFPKHAQPPKKKTFKKKPKEEKKPERVQFTKAGGRREQGRAVSETPIRWEKSKGRDWCAGI